MGKLKNMLRELTLRDVFHASGLTCLLGAVFLQFLVFWDIKMQGAFIGLEYNPAILAIELFVLVPCSFLYLSWLFYDKLLRGGKNL